MLIPREALIATSETDETFDGTIEFVEVEPGLLEIEDTDMALKLTDGGEEDYKWEPHFTEGDEEWEVEDD